MANDQSVTAKILEEEHVSELDPAVREGHLTVMGDGCAS